LIRENHENGMVDMNETTELFAARETGSGAAEDLAAACRYTAELIRIAGVPLRYISVRWAQAAIEMEWPVGDPPPGVLPPSAQAGSPYGHQWPAREAQDEREYICAPLVGTFHRASQPGGKPFVELGDHVEPGRQVAIIEAMKLMNPVQADRPGRVAEFLVPDGTAVEYGQRLIAIVQPA
jgi:acetyl-CoA carboxylase biotin carboxyl carrier protein